ncbi:MAG TPA: matrixin family metalloprotease [Nitrososphaera sp.]|nr:matrixin family metalloprotease [Nitrososphaera sp.]
MCKGLSLLALAVVLFFVLSIDFTFSTAVAANYYSEQTDFTETSVPMTRYTWDKDNIESCIHMEEGIENAYYVWTKLSVQNWRHALQEYTGNHLEWNITAKFVKSEAELESCDVKVYIYDNYRDFPDYPSQTGAYTSVALRDGLGKNDNLDVRIYLSPVVLHGDGQTEINLPPYAFRNSAVHEIGHVLGLGHMQSQKGYLMSPQFDFWQSSEQLPITTLELDALVRVYGLDGFD